MPDLLRVREAVEGIAVPKRSKRRFEGSITLAFDPGSPQANGVEPDVAREDAEEHRVGQSIAREPGRTQTMA